MTGWATFTLHTTRKSASFRNRKKHKGVQKCVCVMTFHCEMNSRSYNIYLSLGIWRNAILWRTLIMNLILKGMVDISPQLLFFVFVCFSKCSTKNKIKKHSCIILKQWENPLTLRNKVYLWRFDTHLSAQIWRQPWVLFALWYIFNIQITSNVSSFNNWSIHLLAT